MGNIIRMHEQNKNTDEWLSMSNGGSSIFLSALVLSGSRVAKSSGEKELIIWLAGHDQNIVGIGTVGFDISDMPWSKDNFKKEKRSFFLKLLREH